MSLPRPEGRPAADPGTRAPGGGRRILRVLAVLLLLGALALLALRWAHLPDDTAWIALQTLSPLGGLLALLALVCAAAARSLPASAAALVPVLAWAALAWPTVHRTTVAPGPQDLTVLSANLLLGQARADDVLAAAERVHADVVVLVEVTPQALERLDRIGLAEGYPHRVGHPAPWASGLVVASRHPVTARPRPSDGRASTPSAVVHAPGGDVLVRGVHPSAPTSPDVWRADLATLGPWVQAQERGMPLVLAGDFNATASHPPFREATAGLTDTSRAAGRGWQPTWPEGRRLPAFAEIDHVLVRDLEVVDAGSVTVRESDHRAVWARLQVRR